MTVPVTIPSHWEVDTIHLDSACGAGLQPSHGAPKKNARRAGPGQAWLGYWGKGAQASTEAWAGRQYDSDDGEARAGRSYHD